MFSLAYVCYRLRGLVGMPATNSYIIHHDIIRVLFTVVSWLSV